MNNKKNNVMKYLGSAMAVGGTVMLGAGLMGDKNSITKKAKKAASKALNTVDGFLNSVQSMIK